jgi:hypothetical protein
MMMMMMLMLMMRPVVWWMFFSTTVSAWTSVSMHRHRTTTNTALHMGLFDGVKEAFSAPALERSAIAADRETPIDRWMGWSVSTDNKNNNNNANENASARRMAGKCLLKMTRVVYSKGHEHVYKWYCTE